MARRTLLSAEQRTRLFGIPTEASEMAKHYVLSPEDLALIRAKRRSGNRLGFAVQLAAPCRSVRFCSCGGVSAAGCSIASALCFSGWRLRFSPIALRS
jgi:hypothetical protein